jgi:hypothetical protein
MYKHILPVSKRAAAIFNSLRFISLIIGLTIGNALFAQATLTLHTNITPGSSSSLDYLGGHAWATLTEGGVTTSYGTWGNNAIDPVTGLTHNGLFVDLELHLGMESSVTLISKRSLQSTSISEIMDGVAPTTALDSPSKFGTLRLHRKIN